ncbi:MAG: FAD-dependent oxidoreductase [Chloroflexi bacterium HGW-Chloroflexi-10]|nr:MAG: FAD-dependent oxidoreductase [Chloroflexi bacterium HGW-Chloroflexi-10]
MKTQTKNLPHVVIVGAGFGGLRAARALRKAAVRVTLIDRNNYHLFQPLLYQVATAGLSVDEIAYPLRGILRGQRNLEFQLAEVQKVDMENQIIRTDLGEMSYDALILAVGSETNFFGNVSLAKNSFGLKGIEEAEAIRNHILHQFELASQTEDHAFRQALLTFVVAGGGPSGVEMAGAISELIRLVLRKDFPRLDFSEVRVLLLEAGDRLLTHLDASLSQAALTALAKKGVEVRFGQQVQAFDGRTLQCTGQEDLPAHTLIWTAGVRAAELVDGLDMQQATQKRVQVLPSLQIPGHANVFLIGDAAYLEGKDGKPLPMVAQVAMQQADTAVQNLLRWLRTEAVQPFVYRDLGTMATIGRNQAVAELFGLRFRGWIAWLIWLFVHLMQLVGFRNRLVVLINWAWEYLLYERAVRLIAHSTVREESWSAHKL